MSQAAHVVEIVPRDAGSISIKVDYARIDLGVLASLSWISEERWRQDSLLAQSQFRLERSRKSLERSLRILEATIAQRKSEQLPAPPFGGKFYAFDSASENWVNLGKVTDVKLNVSDNAVRRFLTR